jgi:hypothetical protein
MVDGCHNALDCLLEAPFGSTYASLHRLQRSLYSLSPAKPLGILQNGSCRTHVLGTTVSRLRTPPNGAYIIRSQLMSCFRIFPQYQRLSQLAMRYIASLGTVIDHLIERHIPVNFWRERLDVPPLTCMRCSTAISPVNQISDTASSAGRHPTVTLASASLASAPEGLILTLPLDPLSAATV